MKQFAMIGCVAMGLSFSSISFAGSDADTKVCADNQQHLQLKHSETNAKVNLCVPSGQDMTTLKMHKSKNAEAYGCTGWPIGPWCVG